MAISTAPVDPTGLRALLDVRAVASLLGCSPRHIYRLSDRGRMPAPIRLGSLVRWRRTDLDSWLADSCPPVRPTRRAAP
jgi:excisionase family DNA binding protein